MRSSICQKHKMAEKASHNGYLSKPTCIFIPLDWVVKSPRLPLPHSSGKDPCLSPPPTHTIPDIGQLGVFHSGSVLPFHTQLKHLLFPKATWTLQVLQASSLPPHYSYVALGFQSLSHVQLFETPWTAARQASLSSTVSWSLLKFTSTESVMPSNPHGGRG